jgi:predicted nucleotidyltransferase component of viral defense system
VVPAAQITQWRQTAPWAADDDVEQDLVICRSIVDIFNTPFLRERLAFRGGTALHKLILTPATRYSEDIDLVFLAQEGVGAVFDATRKALSWVNPKPKTNIGRFVAMYFPFQTTAGSTRRLKIETATKESFSASRVIDRSFSVKSAFFEGSADVRTYSIEELLATKLRALYERKKGRDLYDLWWAAQEKSVDFDRVYEIFLEYWANDGKKPLPRRIVRANMEEKRREAVFADVKPLLTTNAAYDDAAAFAWFEKTVLPLFPP